MTLPNPLTNTISGNRGLQIEEPLIFEMDAPGRSGVDLPNIPDHKERLGGMKRKEPVGLPGLGESQVVRHYTKLSQKDYAIDLPGDPGGRRSRHRPGGHRRHHRLRAHQGPRAWVDSGLDHAWQDPYTVQAIGELKIRERAGAALLDQTKYVDSIERTMMPLARDGRNVDMILSMTVFHWQDGRST